MKIILLLAVSAASMCLLPWSPASARVLFDKTRAPLPSPPSVTVNLSDFGAVGDGVTDAGPALQSALDSLAVQAAGGDGTLIVPAGRYAIVTPVWKDFANAVHSLTIIGPTPVPVPESQGPGRGLGLSAEFVIKVGESVDALGILRLNNLLIQDVVFIGDPTVGADARKVLYLLEISSANIRHCEFYGLATFANEGAIVWAYYSHLKLEDSAFLGSTATTGFTTSVVQNQLWRAITITGTRFIDYGNRPGFFSKTPYATPYSWISIAKPAPHDSVSAWREAYIRDVFLDEGGYYGITAWAEWFHGPATPIDLVHIQGLRMNVSNLNTSGLRLISVERVIVENSHFGWSHNADAAIQLLNIGHAVLDEVECVADATRIYADSATGRLSVINSIYETLDSQAQTTDVLNTPEEQNPVNYVRARFKDGLGREADSAGLFYWSNEILGCGADAVCKTGVENSFDAYLASNPPAYHTISGTVTNSEGGTPLSDVNVALSGSQATSLPSDADGHYTLAGLPTSGIYTVRPSKTFYTFSPTERSFITPNGDSVTDFVATIDRYAITGRVESGGEPLAAVTVTLSGSKSDVTTTDAGGNFAFASLAAGGSYTVTVSKAHFTFRTSSVHTVVSLSSNYFVPTFIADHDLHTISGRLTDSDGAGLDGVRVDIYGSHTTAMMTANGGYYSARFSAQGNYTIAPSQAFYDFTPSTYTFNNLSQDQQGDFIGVQKTFTIGGVITFSNNAQPFAGVAVTLSGSESASTTTDVNGNFFFAVGAGGTYTVTPSLMGYGFDAYPSGEASHTFSAIVSSGSVYFSGALSPPGPLMLVEEGTNDLVAIDSVTLVRGPFTVMTPHNFSSDGRRRLMFFTTDLGLNSGNTTGLSVLANGAPLPVESAGPWPSIGGMSYIIVRLPDLQPGTYVLIVTLNGLNSMNAPIITIIP